MASLGDVPPPPGGGDDGDPPDKKKPPESDAAPVKKQTLADVVAPPYVRPEDWQAPAPIASYERGAGPEICGSPDLTRVLAIPRRAPLEIPSPDADALVAYVTAKYKLPPRAHCRCREIDPERDCIQNLLPLQAWGLHEMSLANGLVAAVPAGGGKSIIFLLAALALRDCKCAALLLPSTLVPQMVTDYEILSQHFRVPSLIVHQGRAQAPLRVASNTDPNVVLHLIAYTRLSSPDASDLLAQISPDAILADEADALSDTTSVRTRRFLRIYQRAPGTRFVCGTGSFTDKGLEDWATLAALALRLNSPMPLDPEVTADWGRAINAGDYPAPPGALMDLCRPGEEVRAGFQRRLRETLGFISSTTSEVRVITTGELVDIIIQKREAPPLPAIIEEALAKVRAGLRPDTLAPAGTPGGESVDDEELVDPMQKAQCAAEVACGMFYRFIFPRGEPRALIEDWFSKRKAYFREQRDMLMLDIPFMDSPHLLDQAARRAHGDIPPGLLDDGTLDPRQPAWPSAAWPAWRDIMDKVEPKSQAVRLHDYLVLDAAEWAEKSPGIVWYTMVEFGQWLSEISGMTLHTGGAGAGARILKEDGRRSIVVSVKSHGRGRNGLQHRFWRQLLSQMLSSSRMNAQLLARLHRLGQKENTVETDVYLHTPEIRKRFRQALSRARYVQETMGERQKLLVGWRDEGAEDEEDDGSGPAGLDE